MKKIALLAGAALGAFVTGLALFHLGMLAFVRSGAERKVPDLVGLEISAAREELSRHDFTGVIEREVFSPDFGEGRVAEQRPAAGQVLRKGRKVRITVSLGVKKTSVPNLAGLSYRQAGIVLAGESLTLGSVARLHHPDVARGAHRLFEKAGRSGKVARVNAPRARRRQHGP